MAEKETIVEDEIYDAILQAIKGYKVLYKGKFIHYDELPDEYLEEKIRYYKRRYNSACKENGIYANWRNVDKYKIAVEYLESLIQDRMNKLFSDFKFVKI